jgi:hypothetical protein
MIIMKIISSIIIQILYLSKYDFFKFLLIRKYIFSSFDSPIKIGRDKSCEINFINNKTISRFQTTIQYNQSNKENEKGWFVMDGTHSKNSTNGTWYINKNYLIYLMIGFMLLVL